MRLSHYCFYLAALASSLTPSWAAPREPSRPIIVSGASNFILDQIRLADSDFVKKNGLTEGDTVLVGPAHRNHLLVAAHSQSLPLVAERSGGAVANTLSGLSLLGAQARAIGSVVDDSFGQSYLADLTRKGVEYRLTEVSDVSPGSGACYIFITECDYQTPEGETLRKIERTMATSLGVSGSLQVSSQDIQWVMDSDLFLAEGYLFSPVSYNGVVSLAHGAKSHGKVIALSISAGLCATAYKEPLNAFIEEYADWVFGDLFEACTLTNTTNVYDAIAVWQSMGKKGAVTCGSEGAYVFDEKHIYAIDPPAVSCIVDATGAGDLFVAGFVSQYLQSHSLVQAGQMGAYCAGSVLQVAGGYPSESLLLAGIQNGDPWRIPVTRIS